MIEITESTGNMFLAIIDKVGFSGFLILFILVVIYKNSRGLCENLIRQHIETKTKLKEIEENRNTILFYLKESQVNLAADMEKLTLKVDIQADAFKEVLAKMDVLGELERLCERDKYNKKQEEIIK